MNMLGFLLFQLKFSKGIVNKSIELTKTRDTDQLGCSDGGTDIVVGSLRNQSLRNPTKALNASRFHSNNVMMAHFHKDGIRGFTQKMA